jgi:hypothetical protein
MERESIMSPRKPTIDDLDDVDDEDGVVEEEVKHPTDLSLGMRQAEDAGLGGSPTNPPDDTGLEDFTDDQEDER